MYSEFMSDYLESETAQEAKSQIIALFKRGQFHLRKWVSNHPPLLSDLPSKDCLAGAVSFDNTETSTLKILGLQWDPSSDTFGFAIESSDRRCTKRSILSETARIFDPLGFLSPITIQAKCMIQKLWVLGIGWDETPPDDVIRTWNTYRDQLPELAQFKIPRKLTCPDAKSYEIHGFCDSSEVAYGAVVYLRVVQASRVNVFLVCSKARVVPLKRISLPRLELCAAVLLSDIYKYVRDIYLSQIKIDNVFMWSDSTIVLSWLRSPSSRWATFVANRVSHIQDITPMECWHHVSSGDNPADICSRGQFPSEILVNSLWWAGPWWLSHDETNWPINSTNRPAQLTTGEESIVRAEARKTVTLTIRADGESQTEAIIEKLINRFSSLQKLVNILTFVRRFITNCRNPAAADRSKFLNNSSSSPSVSTSGEQSQTDESKAQNSSTAEATNVEDERKQQAARTPCFADTVLQNQQIMQKFYRTLSICDGMNTASLNSGMSSEPSSLKEEVFWLVAHMGTVASNPALMVTSLMEFLSE
ncbi:hypothetical protein HF086_009020 [Spodoptera exigua]|uniref:Uncharacterized protein n=1 Tax=Spodoptera exigua TaxID=7107 RepID=A0A922MBK0_SPOEX|nr:hypothetical protein HF086_009020 [Spodoptera exigua]